MSRLLTLHLLLALLVAFPFAAAAQDARDDVWLVLPVGAPDEPDRETVSDVTGALRQASVEVIDPERAASLFEQRHSRAPVRLQPAEVDKLQEAIGQVSHHLALENLNEARQALSVLQQLTPEVSDYLNRKLERAEQIFQACLLMAHLLRKGGYRDKAYYQAGECARSFPGFEPDPQHYPPYIIGLFRRAAAEVQASAPATVRIDATSGEECRARINGVDWGPIPSRVPGIRADEVRVQVECGEIMGRIHRKRIQPGQNEFLIDTRFDRAVQTDTGLWLRYSDPEQGDRQRLQDTIRVARVVGAAQVALVDPASGRIFRIDVPSARYAAFRALEGRILAGAVAELLDLRVEPTAERPGSDFHGPPAALDPAFDHEQPERDLRDDQDRDSSALRLWGYVGAAISVAALGTGWVYWFIRRDETDRRLESDFEADYDGYGVPIVAFGGAGSLGLCASAPLALPEQRGVPWWSYLAGAGGVALATYGIYLWQQDERTCLERAGDQCLKVSRIDPLVGPFLAMQSLPPLSVPVIYLVRHLLRSEPRSLSAVPLLDRHGTALVLSGRF